MFLDQTIQCVAVPVTRDIHHLLQLLCTLTTPSPSPPHSNVRTINPAIINNVLCPLIWTTTPLVTTQKPIRTTPVNDSQFEVFLDTGKSVGKLFFWSK